MDIRFEHPHPRARIERQPTHRAAPATGDARPSTPYARRMIDDVFLVLIFPDGVTRTVGDLPVERLRAVAREWQQLHPGTIAELRRGSGTIELLGE